MIVDLLLLLNDDDDGIEWDSSKYCEVYTVFNTMLVWQRESLAAQFSHVVQRDSSAINFDRAEMKFAFSWLIQWLTETVIFDYWRGGNGRRAQTTR